MRPIEYCADCAYLIEDEDGNWACDLYEVVVTEIEKCDAIGEEDE